MENSAPYHFHRVQARLPIRDLPLKQILWMRVVSLTIQ